MQYETLVIAFPGPKRIDWLISSFTGHSRAGPFILTVDGTYPIVLGRQAAKFRHSCADLQEMSTPEKMLPPSNSRQGSAASQASSSQRVSRFDRQRSSAFNRKGSPRPQTRTPSSQAADAGGQLVSRCFNANAPCRSTLMRGSRSGFVKSEARVL